MLERTEYIENLIKWKDKDLIKVLTGIRRCGKSTIFSLYIKYLKKIGVDKNHIISINLEELEYNFKDYIEFYNFIKDKIKDKKKYYVFIDEVQNIDKWEKAVDSLYVKKNLDIYITGSNAFLLSGELATLLSGRYIELRITPLSFKEFASFYSKEDNDERLYLKYINTSSMPYALKLDNQDDVFAYLDSLYNTIIIKDVITRKKITDPSILKSISKYLFSSVGNLLSVKKIADSLNSDGRKISVHTVENYLDALVESFIFNKVSRYDIKKRKLLQSGDKYYATDVTMRYALLGKKNIDLGFILENIVYLELLRRGFKVFVGKSGDKEVDFVAENKNGITYFQVSYSVRDENTLKRELSSLESINDHYPKYILTMDIDPEVDFNGIKKINVLDWLLDKK